MCFIHTILRCRHASAKTKRYHPHSFLLQRVKKKQKFCHTFGFSTRVAWDENQKWSSVCLIDSMKCLLKLTPRDHKKRSLFFLVYKKSGSESFLCEKVGRGHPNWRRMLPPSCRFCYDLTAGKKKRVLVLLTSQSRQLWQIRALFRDCSRFFDIIICFFFFFWFEYIIFKSKKKDVLAWLD